ncbi:MAG TPA: AAA domain-containing protein [Thermoanaerobaculia bacterium]|nr:AAA domain-containing protein [Thermoanaerobaculia bacterium]
MTTDEEARALLRYWRQSLADGDKIDFESDRAQRETLRLPRTVLATGRIPQEQAQQLFRLQERKTGEDGQEEPKRERKSALPVLLCPLHARLRQAHGAVPAGQVKQVNPLWIPAFLGQDGALSPPSSGGPWIPRSLLEPLQDGALALGTVENLDRFLTRKPIDEIEAGWPSYWSYSAEMLREVTELRFDAFELPGYEVLSEGFVVPRAAAQGFGMRILALYDLLLKESEIPPLLRRYACLTETPSAPLLTAEEQLPYAILHVGQRTSRFPLAPSQREALHHCLAMEEGEILAINGPPGTGKTTLLSSVIASLWVKAAVDADSPPVILVVSTNNQAVTNVLETLGRASETETDLLAERWLPGLRSYGLYCVSAGKTNSEYQELRTDNSGFPREVETADYQSEAAVYFLARASRFAGRELSDLTIATAYLHELLSAVVATLQQGVAAWADWHRVETELETRYLAEGGIDSARARLSAALNEQKQLADEVQQLRLSWLRHANAQPLWWSLFSFLPPVRERVRLRNLEFLITHGLKLEANPHSILQQLEMRVSERDARLQEAKQAVETVERDLEGLSARRERWSAWRTRHSFDESQRPLLEWLDTSLRYRAFLLATHYWEGKWLLEREEDIRQGHEDKSSRAKQWRRWQRYAKLTPCFASTFHMAPRFFSTWEGKDLPFVNAIDLLIVDEAGQVSPEVAGATFGLARRALVVGDVLQIEPVRSLSRQVDRGNLEEAGLAATPEDHDRLSTLGITATEGSVMAVAQGASRYQRGEGERGLLLREHRRCVPEIIQYCNQLAYHGRLEAKRPGISGYPLPHLGYAHVPGKAERAGASWRNPIEAEVLATWIAAHAREIEGYYAATGWRIEELLAVVTPFAAQAKAIRAALRRSGIHDLTIGTVHRLQGAERKVVLFSPVYDCLYSERYFFDQGVNMLNVAVSRAQDSFLVFGDMSLFDPRQSHRASGLLAKHLFSSPDNEITDVVLPPRQEVPAEDRLRGLKAHREILARCFAEAEKRIVIVSPFLSDRAVESDDIPDQVRRAVTRGVEVIIYADRWFCAPNDKVDSRAEKARQLLEKSSAKVKMAERIHNKALCMDDRLLVEGSFNWLSAVRLEGHRHQNYEVSHLLRGDKAAQWIPDLVEAMEARLPGKIR